MYTRLNPPQPVRWGRYIAAFTAVLIAVIGLRAAVAYATNAAVTVTRDCTRTTITVTNQWQYRLDGLFRSSIDFNFEFHLNPGESVTQTPRTEHYGPITFSAFATFSNGAVAHITYNPASQTVTAPADCVPATTAPPLATVPPPPPPVYPSTPTTAVTPPPASDTVTSTSPPTSVTASTAGAAGHPSTIARQLPVTGNASLPLVVGAGALIAVGTVATLVRRRAS